MQKQGTFSDGFIQIWKGAGLALCLSLLGTVIFASILRFSPIADKYIYPINQTLKVLWVSVGAFLAIKGEKGFFKGIGVGALFTALSYLTFSALGGDFSLSWMIFAELAISVGAGALFGSIAVNVKRG